MASVWRPRAGETLTGTITSICICKLTKNGPRERCMKVKTPEDKVLVVPIDDDLEDQFTKELIWEGDFVTFLYDGHRTTITCVR